MTQTRSLTSELNALFLSHSITQWLNDAWVMPYRLAIFTTQWLSDAWVMPLATCKLTSVTNRIKVPQQCVTCPKHSCVISVIHLIAQTITMRITIGWVLGPALKIIRVNFNCRYSQVLTALTVSISGTTCLESILDSWKCSHVTVYLVAVYTGENSFLQIWYIQM